MKTIKEIAIGSAEDLLDTILHETDEDLLRVFMNGLIDLSYEVYLLKRKNDEPGYAPFEMNLN